MASQEEVRLIIKAVTDEAVRNLDKLNKQMEKTEDEGGKLRKGFDVLKSSWLAIAGVAATVGYAISQAFDLAEAAAKFNQSTEAMEMQFGVSSAVIIKKLQEVSGGTIDMANIVTSANRAMALNVTKDVNQMATLLEYARLRARAMGTDTTSAFNDIVTGIGRASPLILDNLGIITKGWAEEAKATGQAYDATFILNKVLSQAATELNNVGKLALTDAEKFQVLNARWEDIKITIGQGLLVAVTNLWDGFQKIRSAIDSVTVTFTIFNTRANAVFLMIGAYALKAAAAIVDPFVWAINKIIDGLNKLPGVHFEHMNNIVAKGAETVEALAEQEFQKAELLAEARQLDLENIIENDIAKEEQEALHRENMNAVAQKALEKENEIKKAADDKKKDQEKNTIKFLNQLDKNFLKTKIENRGLDTANYMQWSQFMMSAMDKNSRWQFALWKAFAIQQTTINTYQAAVAGYNAMAGIPIVGPALGAIAAAAAIAFGLMQVKRIASTEYKGAEEGALIRGVPGSAGTLIRAGENNKDEAIIPLENSDVMDRLGGSTTVNIYNDTAIMDDDYPESIAKKIDAALYKLKQRGMSRAFA